MQLLLEKLTAMLEDTFPSIDVVIAVKKGVAKIAGLVIWSGFTGKTQLERQSLVWNVIRGGLSSEEQLKIGTILTVSPAELAASEELATAR